MIDCYWEQLVVSGTPANFVQVFDAIDGAASPLTLIPPTIPPALVALLSEFFGRIAAAPSTTRLLTDPRNK
jgi:hypothetical protein